MEEATVPFSLNICKFIVENTLVSKAAQNLPPSRSELKHYSSKKSEHITNMIVNATQHPYDQSHNRLSEDTEIIQNNQSLWNINKAKLPKEATHHHSKTDSNQNQSIIHHCQWNSSGLGLVPLTHCEIQSDDQTQGEDIQTRMRDVKIHQENVRTRIMQNFKNTKTKKGTLQYKGQGKVIPKIGVYDYDGSLIEPLKNQAIRYPGHYQEIQVEIQNKEQKTGLLKVTKKKGKNVRFECASKSKEELKPTQSVFLKELNKIQWVDGVEVISGKEECRKILGYHQAANLKKKRIDFSKPTEATKHIRFDDLQNCKSYFKRESSCNFGISSQTNLRHSQIILKKEDLTQTQGPRKIKVANNKALQFLMNEAGEEPIPTKKSVFSVSKKTLNSFHS